MVQKLKIFFGRLSKSRILQHILFWLLSFLILLNVLKVSAEIQRIDLIYTAVFHIPFFLVVYLNLQIFFPLWVEKGKYFLYSFAVLGLIALGAGFYIVLFNHWIDYFFTGYYFIAYYGFLDISLFFGIYLFVSSLLHLARGWFRLQEIEKEKNLTELKALRSQINPHFLFNSLNSIYSLSRKNSPQVPEKIVQLSDLMRHIIYESDAERIPLEKEIKMIKNYIELQNLRTTESEKIELEIAGEITGIKIAPMIFLPFVENSYKHGLKSGAESAFAKIKLAVNGGHLFFEIENSKGNSPVLNDPRYKGIGIDNVKRRLSFIYPGIHSLKITEDEKTFKVNLKIQLK